MSSRPAALAIATLLALLTACAQAPVAPPAVGLLDVAERPAERALLAGMRAYEDAQYPQAEKQLQAALQGNLVSPRDRAAAHKLLAFIFCTSNRMSDCEVQFRAARAADPGFALSKSEAGHPLWGPVYQRVQQR
ncbi:TssQ family T6SS-associated lipoprotein [Piscinibacter sp.]|uniref:TssQ family T6SS-associated lipoprotein n=1 Tax=Piscinibacter sp. TaxID=1903157 RepID=UPI001B48997E|nr:TssQ family T6SS-associated lipoprotein [Piscinibacter sp.]MBP5989014.1 TssQ family T6SS-associated lipoprotein [Piscinibacter sp.]MBP6026266.1 TssQ family T6SS-associated lipoprotein [Piscinibacter sp.]